MNSSNLWIRDLNLLKLKWKTCEKESQLFMNRQCESDISKNDLTELENTISFIFNKDSSILKRNIFKLRRIVKRLDGNMKFSQLPAECFFNNQPKFDAFKNDIETKIKSLNEKINRNIEKLLSDEKQLSVEIAIVNSQIEVWDRNNEPTVKTNIKSSPVSVEFSNLPEEVMQFDKYLRTNGGHSGGWNEKEHSIFVQNRRTYKSKIDFLEILAKLLSGHHTYEQIVDHEEWYAKYLQLLTAKKDAIRRWRVTRKEQMTLRNGIGHVMNTDATPNALSIDITDSRDILDQGMNADCRSREACHPNNISFDKVSPIKFKDAVFSENVESIKEELDRHSGDFLDFFSQVGEVHERGESAQRFSVTIDNGGRDDIRNNPDSVALNNSKMLEHAVKTVTRRIETDSRPAVVKKNENLKDSRQSRYNERTRIKEKIQQWKTEQDKLNDEKERRLLIKRIQEKETQSLKLQQQGIEREKLAVLRQEQKCELEKFTAWRRGEEERMMNVRRRYASLLANEYAERELEKLKTKRNLQIVIKESLERDRTERLDKMKYKAGVSAARTREPTGYMQPTFSSIEKEKSHLSDDSNAENKIAINFFTLSRKSIPRWRQDLT